MSHVSETKPLGRKELVALAILRAIEHHHIRAVDILAIDVKEYVFRNQKELDVIIYLRGSPIYIEVHLDKNGNIKRSHIGWINPKEA